MTVRVDYRCQQCGHVGELIIDTPTTTTRCAECGGTAKRMWSGFGIGSGAGSQAGFEGPVGFGTGVGQRSSPAAPATLPSDGELCRTSPGVPGLCLLGESAGRTLVARAANDGRTLEREQRAQTGFLDQTGRPGTVVSDHGHSHGGGSPAGGNQKAVGHGPREIC